ncbi:MAG TPA: epoxide hydrolase [Puia sp.]|nr:epoxide hydrolase [Puia sp.]
MGTASTTAPATGIEPFTINVSPYIIEDLRERLGRARWPDEIPGSGWRYGANKTYLQQLCAHWGHGFDWKEQEELLNGFRHFRMTIDGLGLHFIRQKGAGPHRVPILLLHGYPDSFFRFLKLIPLLTEPGPGDQSFDVVVPSMPGYGFSDRPTKPGMNVVRIAALYARLMERLGYDKYMVHGGDIGSLVARELAHAHPERVIALHLTEVPFQHLFTLPADQLSAPEEEWLRTGAMWQRTEGAYNLLQSTKPDTLAFALNDSPIGLAAWIIEKFHGWTDHSGDLEEIYTRNELLVNLTIYWVTQTAASAFRLYYETAQQPAPSAKRLKTPVAILIAARELVPAPREAADRIFNVVQWNELPHGGHFLAMERPKDLAADLFCLAATLAPGTRE